MHNAGKLLTARYSMRALFAGVAFCAVVFAWVGSQLRHFERQQSARERIESHGGYAGHEDELVDKLYPFGNPYGLNKTAVSKPWISQVFSGWFGNEVISVEITGKNVAHNDLELLNRFAELRYLGLDQDAATGFGDCELRHLRGLRQLTQIDLSGSDISGTGLVHLAELHKLWELDLSYSPLISSHLIHLEHLQNLQVLNLAGTGIEDEALVHISRLKNLRALLLNHGRITDKGFKHLSRLKNLSLLHVDACPLTDASIDVIAGMNHLEILWLHETQFTAPGISRMVERLPRLQTLWLDGLAIRDRDLANFHQSGSLAYLSLRSTKITDAGIEHLGKIQSMRKIYLSNTAVTKAGAAKLRRLLPKARINTDTEFMGLGEKGPHFD